MFTKLAAFSTDQTRHWSSRPVWSDLSVCSSSSSLSSFSSSTLRNERGPRLQKTKFLARQTHPTSNKLEWIKHHLEWIRRPPVSSPSIVAQASYQVDISGGIIHVLSYPQRTMKVGCRLTMTSIYRLQICIKAPSSIVDWRSRSPTASLKASSWTRVTPSSTSEQCSRYSTHWFVNDKRRLPMESDPCFHHQWTWMKVVWLCSRCQIILLIYSKIVEAVWVHLKLWMIITISPILYQR